MSNSTSDVSFLPNGGTYAGRPSNSSVHEIRKLLPNGSPDTSFSGDGRAGALCGGDHGVHIQADQVGRALLVCTRDRGTFYEFKMLRYTTAGPLDDTYSDDGIEPLTPSSIDHDAGYLLHETSTGAVWLVGRSVSDPTNLVVYSIDENGKPSPSWGTGVSESDVGFDVHLNRTAIGGSRTWVALQKSATVTALVALVP